MTEKKDALSPQLKALKTADLTPLIRMSGLMIPRALNSFLPNLNSKQRSAIDKVMPARGGKKIYLHLVGTSTPPIVIEMAQPLKMNTFTENEVKQQKIKGLKLTIEDLQVLIEKRIGKLLWRLKGQIGTLLSLSGMFVPFILLGPGELKDMQNKAMTYFKPMFDLLPNTKK